MRTNNPAADFEPWKAIEKLQKEKAELLEILEEIFHYIPLSRSDRAREAINNLKGE